MSWAKDAPIAIYMCVLSAAGGMLHAVYCVLCIVCCPLRVVRLVVYGAVLCIGGVS